jgi:hypothetical protein
MTAISIRLRGGKYEGYGNWSHFPQQQLPAAVANSEDGSEEEQDDDSDGEEDDDGGDIPDDGKIMIDVSQDDMCVICQEDISDQDVDIYTSCYHHFHFSCFYSMCAATPNPRCPLCRAAVVFETSDMDVDEDDGPSDPTPMDIAMDERVI